MIVSPRPAPPGSIAVTPSAESPREVFDVGVHPLDEFRSPAWHPGTDRDGPVTRTKPPIRVAFLTPSLLMGGAERWMISLARCCDPARIEWTGTALTEWAHASEELCREMAAFMPIHAGPRAGPPGGSSFIVRWPSARAALDAVLAGADVLMTWGVEDLRQLIGTSRIRAVYVSHGGGPDGSRASRRSEAGTTHFVAVSEPARRLFSPDVRDRATILHNGIDVPRCTPTRTRAQTRSLWGLGERHRLIGYVGRYSSEKNPLAARAVANLGGDYRAVYAGVGWMEAELRREAGSSAGHKALFVPPERQVGDILCALDAFVLASPAEGFSLSMAEAWYCGVPVVATRVGAVRELERRFGSLVSPVPIDPSPTALAAAVEEALRAGFRRDVVPRARAMVCRHFTAAAMAGRWMNYLESICHGATGKSGRPRVTDRRQSARYGDPRANAPGRPPVTGLAQSRRSATIECIRIHVRCAVGP